MTDPEKVAESYRALSQFWATISGGLFVAGGIAASLFTASLNSGIALMRTSIQTSQIQRFNNTTSVNLSSSLADASMSAIKSSEAGFYLLMANIFFAFLTAALGLHYWRKSHEIITNIRGVKADERK